VLVTALAAACGGQASPPPPKHPLAAGAAADLGRVAGLRIAGAHAGDAIGGRIAAAGDVNGDGLADLLIGSPTSSTSATFAGSAYVVYGRRGTADIDLARLGDGGFRIEGAQTGDRIGEAVDGAGDVNGDGLDDVVVGSSTIDARGPNSDSGAAFVVFGSRSAADVRIDRLGARGFEVVGARPNDLTAEAVAGAGDVDGDRRDDVIIGSPDALGGKGAADVVFGPRPSAARSTAPVDLAHPSGRARRLVGQVAGGETVRDDAGSSVAGVGDIDRDGYGDVMVGAVVRSPLGRSEAGTAYVVRGPLRAGPPLALGRLGRRALEIDGAHPGDNAGFALAGLGDVDGDRHADLGLSAPASLLAGGGHGYAVFGGRRDARFGVKLDLGRLGRNGIAIDAPEPKARLATIAGPGDVDGDGRADILVGMPRLGTGQEGGAYLVRGGPGGTIKLARPSPRAIPIRGAHRGDLAGTAVAGPGDVNGDHRPDLAIGGATADPHGRTAAGEVWVIEGIP
jgi:hypothetical protein